MTDRRKFVAALCGTGALTVLGCGPEAPQDSTPSGSPDIVDGIMTIPLADFPTLAGKDGSLGVSGTPVGSVIVARVDETDQYVCVSRRCTHQGCSVNYDEADNEFACPCHGASYALDGHVLGGPAPAGLHSYTTTFDGTNVVVDLNS